MSKTLGQFLKELRALDHYSQEFVASYLNIIRQTYSHYETGRIIPPADSLYKLSQLYNVPIERFFELTNNSPTNDNTYDTNKKPLNNIITQSSKSYSFVTNTMDINKLTANELEMLFYYQQLDVQDKLDILDFMKIKYRRYKNKK